MENYYSDDVYNFIRWLYKSVFGIIFFGLIGSALAFAPQWGNAFYMFAGIFMFVYVFVSFQNYMLYYEVVDEAVKLSGEVAETDTTSEYPDAEVAATGKLIPKKDGRERLRYGIEEWIAGGGYRQNGVTVALLLQAVHEGDGNVSRQMEKGAGGEP